MYINLYVYAVFSCISVSVIEDANIAKSIMILLIWWAAGKIVHECTTEVAVKGPLQNGKLSVFSMQLIYIYMYIENLYILLSLWLHHVFLKQVLCLPCTPCALSASTKWPHPFSSHFQLPDDADKYLPEEEEVLLPTSPFEMENGVMSCKKRDHTPEDEKKSSDNYIVSPEDQSTPPVKRKPGGIQVLPAVFHGDSGSTSLELDDITRTPDEADSLKVSNVWPFPHD